MTSKLEYHAFFDQHEDAFDAFLTSLLISDNSVLVTVPFEVTRQILLNERKWREEEATVLT